MPAPDIRSLDVGMLRTFDALMRERSVSRAATRLFLSQPAVSASLRRLREVFGDPLFTRTSHGIEPTARAQALGADIEQVLAMLSSLLDDPLGFEPARSQRVFRIAGSDHASQLVLPELARGLAEAGSRIQVFWEAASFPTIPDRLRRGDFDLAILPRLSAPDGLEAALLYEDRYVVATRKGHPRFRAGATLDVFCEVPQIILGYGRSAVDDLVDAALARTGRQRLAQLAVTSFGQIADLLTRSDHAAVLPSRVALHYRDRLASHPLPVELARYGLYVCWSHRCSADTAVQWLQQRIRSIVAETVPAVESAP